jgi:hypothetical protein
MAESAAAEEVAKPAWFNPVIFPAEVERALYDAARGIRVARYGSYRGGHSSSSSFKDKRMTATPFGFKTP